MLALLDLEASFEGARLDCLAKNFAEAGFVTRARLQSGQKEDALQFAGL
jgi:hypothetical protein